MVKRFLLLVLVILLPAHAPAADAPGEPGMVSCADPRAAAAGVEILRAGGSAADAAIATALALNVVEPQSSGIGGGGFFLHHDAKTGRTDGFDGRETAPAAATDHWFYTADGQPLAHDAAVPGGRSVGVPGNLREWAKVHRLHGRLPWARLFAPAIRLADKGFQISPRLHDILTSYGGHLDAGATALFFDGGQPRAAGTTVRNPDQAALLTRIARLGPDAFYVGPQAEKLTATVNGAARNPSQMSTGDLASYDAKERPPVCGSYRGYRICGMGPPSSGGVAVLAILKQLERFDMGALGKNSPVAWHLLAESERLAYADRDMYLGDPDHVAVPVRGLTDPAYLAARSHLIESDRSIPRVTAGTPAGAPRRIRAEPGEVPGTTHIVAVDRQGDVATVTSTIEGPFGSGLMMDGIFLNNELTDFDIVPTRDGDLAANRVEGGKRPRSSMSPTIAYGPDGRVRIAIGAAGGSTIIAQVAKALVAVIDWHLSAQEAIALPLLYAPGRTAVLEQGTALEAMAPALRDLGESVRIAPLGLKANAIEWADGHWRGAADPRSEGVALSEAGGVPFTRPREPAPSMPTE